MNDDAELLRRYAEEKSEVAFGELVQRHIDLVYSAAQRRLGGDAHGAADVAQRVFVSLARQASALSRHPVLPAWLYATTRHVAIDHARAERRRKVHEQAASFMLNENPTAADWERLRPLLDGTMDELSDRDREAVVLRFFARRPFAEVGRALRLSEDAARMRVDRALEKLRALLSRRGVTSTAAALGSTLSHHAVAAAPAGLGTTVTTSVLTSVSASVAAPVSGMFQFMGTSKFVGAGAALVLALAVGTAVREINARREAEAALGFARQRAAATVADLRELRGRAEVAEQGLAVARQANAAEKKRIADVAATARAATLAEGEAFLTRHPEVKRAALAYWRTDMGGRYRPLFKSLGLSSVQIERFKDLAVQGITGIATGPNGEMIRYSLGGNRREAEEEMRALLGEDGVRRYREFSGAGWSTVNEMAGALFNSPAPLSSAQGEQLARILADGRVRVAWSGQPQFDWDTINMKAQQVLAPLQFEEFLNLQAHDRFSQARSEWGWSLQQAAKAGAAAAK
jgi:RNA polymerase sigma factor (sigma-70 family)